jgi:NTE family protein
MPRPFLCVLLFGVSACSTHSSLPPVAPVQPLASIEQAPEPILEPPKKVEIPRPKIALVLSGGGARGLAHVGVLRVLHEAGVPVDLIVGTSVGALVGARYAANPDIFELEWMAQRVTKDDIFDFSFLSGAMGPVKGDALIDFVGANFPESQIENFQIPFVAVAAALETGEKVTFDRGDISTALRASVSIPGVFRPFNHEGKLLIDGGVVENIPVSTAHERGADIVLASSVTKSVHATKLDNVVDVILQSITIMMAKSAHHELETADVVFEPPIGEIGTMDFTQTKRSLSEGVRTARAQLHLVYEVIERYYRTRGGVIPDELEAIRHIAKRHQRKDRGESENVGSEAILTPQ